MGSCHSSFKATVRPSVLIPPESSTFYEASSCYQSRVSRTLDNPDLIQKKLEYFTTLCSARRERMNMSTYRTSEDSLTNFLSTFNQVLLGYILLAVVLSTSIEGVLMDSSASDSLVHDDYNFEIKTAMERTKNHTAFMIGIIALTFAAVAFVVVDWAKLKFKHVWDVNVSKN